MHEIRFIRPDGTVDWAEVRRADLITAADLDAITESASRPSPETPDVTMEVALAEAVEAINAREGKPMHNPSGDDRFNRLADRLGRIEIFIAGMTIGFLVALVIVFGLP